MKDINHCSAHSGHNISINNIEKDIEEIKEDIKFFKDHNTNRHDVLFQRIDGVKKELGEFRTSVLDRVSKIDKKTAYISAFISVASYFVFQLLWRLLEKAFLGMK